MNIGRGQASPPGQILKGTTRLMKSARSFTGLAMAAVSVTSLSLAPMASAQDAPAAPAAVYAPQTVPAAAVDAPLPTVSESVAAIVNDDIVSTYDLVQRMRLLVLTAGIQPTQENLPQLQQEALRGLVEERLEMQELRRVERENKIEIVADDADVDAAVADMARGANNMTAEQLLAQLRASGIGPETLRVTTLGSLAQGSLVNLERSLRADGRFGGHFVQGHVDAVGRIEEVRPDVDFHTVTVSFPSRFASNIIHRGSIAVDGISLTVAALRSHEFDLMIIPFTMAHTNMRQAAIGTPVNLEFDMVGKYVVRATELAVASSAASGASKRSI